MNRFFSDLGALLFFGLGWSLVVPLTLILMPAVATGPRPFCAALVLSAAAFALLTARRLRRPWTTVFFAVAILALFAAAGVGVRTCILAAAAVLGWIRTAGRRPDRPALAPAAELVSALGTICLAIGFRPAGPMVIGLGIWLFYLLQIFPLAVAGNGGRIATPDALRARFKETRQRVEKILAARI